jgi:ABC-type glutathione transport system ATPase component
MSKIVPPLESTPESVTPLLQVRDLKMHFPIKEAAGLGRTKKVVQAVDGVNSTWSRAAAWAWSASPAVASRRRAG